MYNFKYVAKREFMPLKNELIELIHQVQDQVRDYFTFRFDFVGSSQRNIITSDNSSNVGFDFDVNIQVNDDDEEYGPKEIKHILMNGFNEILKLIILNMIIVRIPLVSLQLKLRIMKIVK